MNWSEWILCMCMGICGALMILSLISFEYNYWYGIVFLIGFVICAIFGVKCYEHLER